MKIVSQSEKRQKAGYAVRVAQKEGKIPHISTQGCEHCNKQAEHYHHPSYKEEHWLDVIPLCRDCHNAVHHPETVTNCNDLLESVEMSGNASLSGYDEFRYMLCLIIKTLKQEDDLIRHTFGRVAIRLSEAIKALPPRTKRRGGRRVTLSGLERAP